MVPENCSWEPSPVQTSLLRTALASSADACPAWRDFVNQFPDTANDLARLDWGTRRLLPLVAWQLRTADLAEDLGVPQLRSHLAQSMLVTRRRTVDHRNVLSRLQEAGIETLVLKGVALGSMVYPDPGTRPSSDIDVLIRPRDYDRAMDLIESDGMRTDYLQFDRAVIRRFRHSAGVELTGHAFDLHWRLLSERLDESIDAGLWDRSVVVNLAGAPVATLCPEDHLLHAVLHGMRSNQLSPVRWVADSAFIIRSSPIDWELLTEQAGRRHVGGSLAAGLDYLRQNFDVNVSDVVLRRLRASESRLWTLTDRWSRDVHRPLAVKCLNSQFVSYGLATRGLPVGRRVSSYPDFVRFANVSRRIDGSASSTRSTPADVAPSRTIGQSVTVGCDWLC